MKATKQYFPVVLFIMLCKVVLTFGSVDEIQSVTIQMKATEQYFPVVVPVISMGVLNTPTFPWRVPLGRFYADITFVLETFLQHCDLITLITVKSQQTSVITYKDNSVKKLK